MKFKELLKSLSPYCLCTVTTQRASRLAWKKKEGAYTHPPVSRNFLPEIFLNDLELEVCVYTCNLSPFEYLKTFWSARYTLFFFTSVSKKISN